MTYRELLQRSIESHRSHLCVGLDPLPEKITGSVDDFLRRVIGETAPHAAAYKPNIAFFEAMGSAGYRLLEGLRDLIPAGTPLILDAKRSDIPDTQAMYARAYFDVLRADAVTLNVLLGRDSLQPFLTDQSKGVYVLGLTSNPGSADFLAQNLGDRPLWKVFVDLCSDPSLGPGTLGAVMGLTRQTAGRLRRTARCAPAHPRPRRAGRGRRRSRRTRLTPRPVARQCLALHSLSRGRPCPHGASRRGIPPHHQPRRRTLSGPPPCMTNFPWA